LVGIRHLAEGDCGEATDVLPEVKDHVVVCSVQSDWVGDGGGAVSRLQLLALFVDRLVKNGYGHEGA
jgi:hypothetical protein